MSAQLIDGKAVAAAVRSDIRRAVEDWTQEGRRPPVLRVVLVGDHPASASYVRGKIKAAAEVGIDSDTIRLPADVPEADLLGLVRELNANPDVDGILVQLPLPDHVDEAEVIHTLSAEKDVDGFTPENVGRLVIGEDAFEPCTPAGILELLRRSGVATRGAHAVVIGRSNIVGKPMANLLMRRGTDATVTVCHSRTRDLPALARQADLLVAAIGRAHFVTADMVKEGAAVIDVGINRVDDAGRERGYRLVGDVDFEAVREKAGWITPVPGGVGPMTIAMLLKNTLEAARRRRGPDA
ncbi:MAG: bifunctional methylenetetrahydrofolate dehydrogenase/methenyltetrahydrofolate cyclohydrolase FolD [Rhodothermales bacterium]|nr:bifunctional methylenetetrahydrofolate dehydrogenase/methenyltetrahydrofolate cyclohydrolase FolD [Rhodothermales bacterium]